MDEKNRKTILWKLFISTLYLSAFTFGGGYVIVTLMKNKFVDEYHWIEENEMLDLVAIAQSSPGAIAVNGAIVVGYKLAGVVGIFITILGTILPPFIVLTVVSIFYNAFKSNWLISQLLEGMQAGVGAVIASVTVDMAAPIVKEKNHLSLIIMCVAFIAACVFSVNVVYIVIACGVIGVIRTLLCKKEKRKMMYLQLFLSFIQVGIFSFGGGYAAMPLIQSQVVTNHKWLTMSEFTDLITISQMTPGPIAVNSATFVGLKIAGVLGAVVATFGCILPSCIIVTVLAKLYLKYRSMDMMQEVLYSLRPAVVAMIASAGILILMTAFWGNGAVTFVKTKWVMVLIFIICVTLLRKARMNPICVMVLAGIMKVIASFA